MERLSALFDAASVGISVLDTQGIILRVNPKLCELFGLSEKELIGMSSKEVSFSSEEDSSWSYYDRTIQEKSHIPIRLTKKYKKYNGDKDFWWADLWISPIYYETKNEVEYFVAVLIDVTERKKIREELQESREHYRSLFDNLSTAVAVYKVINGGEDFIFIDFNKAGEKLEQMPKEKLLAKSVLEAFPNVKEFGLFEVFQRVYRTGTPELFPAKEYRDTRLGGRWRENFVYKQPTGEIIALYSDVTERKIAEDALKQSEKKFALAFNTAPYALSINKFSDGTIIEVNDAFIKITGFTRAEIIGNTIDNLNIWSSIEDKNFIIDKIKKYGGVKSKELQFRLKDGNFITGLFSCTKIMLKSEIYILSSTYDITEQKEMETALEASRIALTNIEAAKQKDLLDSARALNAGIAHELRTPLQALLNALELVDFQLDEIESTGTEAHVRIIKDYLSDAKKQLDYTDVVLNSLSAFAKAGASPQSHLINVVTELKTAMRTLRYTDKFKGLKESQFILTGLKTALFININPIEFGQIINNLCKNSIESIKEEDPFIQLNISIDNQNVKISIIDNGEGIPSDVGDKVFEPYFSTKEPKEVYNQGLGLAIVKNIVFAYNGHISYASVPGRTEFNLFFPLVNKMEKEI